MWELKEEVGQSEFVWSRGGKMHEAAQLAMHQQQHTHIIIKKPAVYINMWIDSTEPRTKTVYMLFLTAAN